MGSRLRIDASWVDVDGASVAIDGPSPWSSAVLRILPVEASGIVRGAAKLLEGQPNHSVRQWPDNNTRAQQSHLETGTQQRGGTGSILGQHRSTAKTKGCESKPKLKLGLLQNPGEWGVEEPPINRRVPPSASLQG